jgi:hypothetical protein
MSMVQRPSSAFLDIVSSTPRIELLGLAMTVNLLLWLGIIGAAQAVL